MTTPLAAALHEAMVARGFTPANLARAAGMNLTTLSNITAGKVACPQERQRDSLDDYLTPKLPRGTTLRIVNGDLTSYPDDPLVALVARVGELPDEAQRHLADFLRSLRVS